MGTVIRPQSWILCLHLASVVIVSVLTYCFFEPAIASDMGWYISRALNITNGAGYTGPDMDTIYIDRGPVFPLLIAQALSFDKSIASAMSIVSLACIGTTVALWFLGKTIASSSVGFMAAITYCSTFVVNFYSLRHIDVYAPLTFLLAMGLSWLALERTSKLYALLTGVIFGMSYLTKESAFLYFFIPFAFLLAIPEFRTRKHLALSLISIFVGFLPICAWFAYSWYIAGGFSILGVQGSMAGMVVIRAIVKAFDKGFTGIIELLLQVWWPLIGNQVPFGIIFVLSWFYVLISSWKIGYTAERVVLIGLIFCAPVAVYTSLLAWRPGYNLTFYCFSYMATALMIYRLSLLASQRYSKIAGLAVSGIYVLSWVAIQTFVPNKSGLSNINYLANSTILAPLTTSASAAERPNYFPQDLLQNIIASISERDNDDLIVMTDTTPIGDGIFFYSDGAFPVLNVPRQLCLFGQPTHSSATLTDTSSLPIYYRFHRSLSIVLYPQSIGNLVRSKGVTHYLDTGFYGDVVRKYMQYYGAGYEVASWETDTLYGNVSLWRLNKEWDFKVHIKQETRIASSTKRALRKASRKERMQIVDDLSECLYDGARKKSIKLWLGLN